MTTIAALYHNPTRLDRSPGCIGNDTRHHYQLTNDIALQISQHLRMLITPELDLEARHWVKVFKIITEVVGSVYLLNRILKLYN